VINFNFESSTAVSVQLLDVLGKEVGASINKNVAAEKINYSTSQLSDGVYFLNINYNGQVQSTKLIK
jgi:hypothetical protein